MSGRQKVKKTGAKAMLNHFVPHQGNNYLPYALRHGALLVYSALLVGIKAALIAIAIIFPSASLYSFEISETSVLKLTNQARTAAGLSDVSINPLLRSAAQAKADDMLIRQYFSHEGPEGESPWAWLKRTGYRYKFAGENLAIHYSTAEALDQGWLASPSHRANILDKRFQEVGIGVARGKIEGYESMVVVQLFATPTTNKAIPQPDPSNRVLGTKIDSKGDQLQITVKAPATASVSGNIGGTSVPFTFDQIQQVWLGTVDPQANLGETIKATVQTEGLPPETRTLAVLVEDKNVQNLYRAQTNDDAKILGFSLSGLGDSTQRFYIYALLTLAVLLLLNVVIKFKIQHPKNVAHTLLVMGLTFLFSMF